MQGASLCWTIAVLLMARAATAVATEETAVADATVVDAGATTMATSTTTVVSGIGCNCIGCCLNSTATQMPPSPHRTTALRLAQLARAARRGGSRAQQSPPPPLAASPPPAFDRRFCCDGCRGPNPGEVSAHVRQACSTPPNQECAAPDHKDRRLGVCCPRVQCKGLQQLGHRGGPGAASCTKRCNQTAVVKANRSCDHFAPPCMLPPARCHDYPEVLLSTYKVTTVLPLFPRWTEGPSSSPPSSSQLSLELSEITQSALRRKRAVVCLFGVLCRSWRVTWPTVQRRVIDVLRSQGMDVDVYMFSLETGSAPVYFSAGGGCKCPPMPTDDVHGPYRNDSKLIFEARSQEEVDALIHKRCAASAAASAIASAEAANATASGASTANALVARRCDTLFRGNSYSCCPARTLNAIRQLYSESRVAAFLRTSSHDVAVVTGPDYFLSLDVDLRTLAAALQTARGDRTVYTTKVNDNHGYTNGYYVGRPAAVALVMDRFAYVGGRAPPTTKVLDYESLLRHAFLDAGATRQVSDQVFFKVRPSGQVYWQGWPVIAMHRLPCHKQAQVRVEYADAQRQALRTLTCVHAAQTTSNETAEEYALRILAAPSRRQRRHQRRVGGVGGV